MEEKMMILKMLQEGKITSEEACRLLEAVEGGKSDTKQSARPNTAHQTAGKSWDIKLDEKMRHIDEKLNKVGDKLNNKFNIDSDRFSNDFSKKVESLGSDIAESASKFADKMVSYFGNVLDLNGDKYQATKSYVYPVSGTANIELSSSNFSVKVNPAGTEDIIVSVYTNSSMQPAAIDEHFKADISNNDYRFECRFPGKVWGKIELLVPAALGNLNITTSNGKCEIGQIKTPMVRCHTSNGKIVLEQCQGDNIDVVTNNGKIVLEQTTANAANLSTSNSKIEITQCKFDIIDAKTSNGSIQVSELNKLKAREARYDLYTSNGKIGIELEQNPVCGYILDANTSWGGIHVDLPQLHYSVDRKNHTAQSSALIKSSNIETAEEKIYITANTSNASITVES